MWDMSLYIAARMNACTERPATAPSIKLFADIAKRNQIVWLLVIYSIIGFLTMYFFDGTGDSGDSIYHYMFAKYAPVHPEHFFNHWAKPVYVILACPFAQFGFIGIKVFNVLVSVLTIFFTFKIVEKLNIRNAILSPLILIFSPLYFILTFSGLTEPLFALFVSIGVYLILINKYTVASLFISFLPFVRSEGLIIIGVFGLYFLIKREWKLILLLMFGHVVYSISGFFIFNDFLWVFRQIPYARMDSIYGSGKITHFIEQMMYVTGVPVNILFWLGVGSIIWKSIKRSVNIEVQILVFAGFFSYFIAHSLFWYFGICNSMGLKRVLIGVAPLIAIISLMGFNFITEEVFKSKRTARLIVQGLLIAYILIFPFTSNPAALKWKRDLCLSQDQQSAIEVADFIVKNTDTNRCFVFAHPYLSEVLGVDPFDNSKRLELTQEAIDRTKTGDIIIWENWFAVVEHRVSKAYLDNSNELVNIYNVEHRHRNQEILFSVYRRK